MKRVQLDELDRTAGPWSLKRPVADALGTTNVSINYYELAPNESFAFGYHAHELQEEVFYIQAGTVTFETEDGDVVVGAGEFIHFSPGEYQRGVNRGTERVAALALGAPRDTGKLDMRRDCEPCGQRTRNRIERSDDGRTVITICTECGAETGRFT